MLNITIENLEKALNDSKFIEDIGSRRKIPSSISEGLKVTSKVVSHHIQDYNDMREMLNQNLDM